MKTCSRCGKSKEITAFGKNRSRRDCRDGYCRECRGAYMRPWKQADYREKREAVGLRVVPGDKPTEDRFMEKVALPDENGCRLWLGRTSRAGYGMFQVNRRTIPAHRYAYELANGPIPPDLEIDHLCRVRACVNPEHLEPVTPAENQRRANLVTGRAGPTKTHCVNGHPWTAETIVDRGKHGRTCRLCLRAAHRRAAAKKAGV